MKKIASKLTVILVLTSLLLSGCKGNQKDRKQPELLTPVNVSEKTEKVTYRDISNTTSIDTYVIPVSEGVFFTEDGVFGEYHVNIGDKVKKGQKLASQSNKQLEQELKQLQNTYDETKTNYDNERKMNDLNIKIIKEKLVKEETNIKTATAGNATVIRYNIDKLKLEQKSIQHIAKVKYQEYEQMLSNYDSKIATLKNKMRSNYIVAPFDGIVTSVAYDLKEGDDVRAYSSVVRVVDNSRLQIYFNEYMLDPAFYQPDRYYVIINGKEYEVEASNQFMIQQSKKEDMPKAGESVILCVQSNYRKHVMSLTNKAIYSEGANLRYVHRIKDGKKEKVPVKIGAITDIYTEIISGLQEGDVVYSD